MKACPAHFVRGHVRLSIARHKRIFEKSPSQVLIGLMDMRSLEEAHGARPTGQTTMVDGVPIVVGGLEDGARCIP